MNKVISLLLFTIICSFSTAQQKGSNISFDDDMHNFGNIKEVDGPVSFTFNFTNTGSEPLIIQNVQPSCGCTTPEWSKEPVIPGGKGYVKATFNPAGRPGVFSKSILVVNNSAQNQVVLKITGEVIGKEPTVVEKFPYLIDNMRFNSTYVAYGRISPGKQYTKTVEVMNVGASPVNISFSSVPSHLDVMVNPSTVKPNQKATIEITYDPQKKNDWGFLSDAIEYSLNNKKDAKYKLNLSAILEDNYADATPQQLADAPKFAAENTVFNFDRIKGGVNIELSFKFKNIGKTNLVIHKLQPSCGCTNVKVKENVIKPGATGEITGVFKSAGQKGSVNKTITVLTNDPKNLNAVLWIRGTVE
jgi:hypothetical protein